MYEMVSMIGYYKESGSISALFAKSPEPLLAQLKNLTYSMYDSTSYRVEEALYSFCIAQ
jgi:hypothetical protein